MPAGARYVAVLRPASLLAAAIAACAFVLLGFTVPVQATAPAPVAVGSNPRSVAISPDGSFAYVSALDAGTVSRVDTATNTVTASITTGGRPWFVAFAPSGAFAYVTDFGRGTVMRLRASDDTVVNTIPVGQNPRSVSFSPDGVFAYVAGEDGFVRRIQTSNDTVTATIAVGGLVTSIDISPSGSYAYVANFGLAAVQRIDTNSDRVVATVSLPVPYFVDIAPSGDFAYVSNHYAKTVTRLRTSDNAIAATTAVGDTPLGLRISPDSSCAFVSVYADNVVKRIRTDSDVVAGTIPLAGPYGVAIATDMHSAFVSSISTNTLSKISAPDAPALTQATPGDGTTQIHFVPGADNNYPITNYEYSIDDGDHWTTPNPASTTSPITITGLTNGTTYTVRLRALNSAGTGTPSSPITVTPRRLPGAPTNLAAEVGDRQAVVAFTAAALDGVKPLTNYEYSTNDGATWTALSPASTTSPITITGLTNGTTYPIRLRAINADGSGTSSDAISVTPRTTPTEPTLTSADAGDSQTTLRFSPPVSDGGAPITNYAYSIDDGAHWTTPNPASTTSPITITGLTNGTTYTVRLRALNSAGTGTPSSPITVTPRRLPGAPTNLAAEVGDRQAVVAFTAAALDGVKPLTNYEYSTNDGATWTALSPASTTSPITITGLTNGTTYPIRLRAINADGSGTSSDAISVTPRTTPTEPTLTSADAGDSQTTLRFSPPVSDGGAPITNYAYSIDDGAHWTTPNPASTTSPITITGLTNGTTYTVRLRALNSAGASPASNNLTVTPLTVPSAPTLLSVQPGQRQATVEFATPAANGGSPITNYQYSIDDGDSWTARQPASTATTFTIGDMINGTTYRVKIRAANVIGHGPASNAIAVLPRTQSTPPQQVSVVPGDKQVRVSWSPPADAGGLPISAYVATAQPGGNVCSTAGTTSCVISGLSNGGWYRVAVTAVTDFGVSAPSALSALVIPRSVPGAPISVLARAGFEEVTVNWGVASSSGGRPILGYRVTSIDGSLTCSPGPSARSCVFRKVPGDRSYRFLVQARNEAGYSTPRISTIVKTKFLPRPPVLAGWPSTFMVVLNTMTGFNANYWTPRGTRITRVELQALQDGRVVAQGPTVGLPPGSYRLSQRVWYVMSNGQAGVAGWSQLIRINSYNPVPQVGVGTPNNFVLTAKGPLLTLVSRTESGGLRRIVGRITTDGAREFCFRDPGNEVGSGRLSFDGCVTEVLQGTRFGNLAGRDFVAFAQCPTGRISPATLFQNALNGWWQSAGRPGYWTNMENGRQINPSNASGGGVLLGQFNLACV